MCCNKKRGILAFLFAIILLIIVTVNANANLEKQTSKKRTNLGNTLDINMPTAELKPLKIKEGETYQIENFITKMNIPFPEIINYNYKDMKMGKYTKAGNYEVTIIFNGQNNNKIEKSTTLTIEEKVNTKVEPKKVSSKKTVSKKVTTKKLTFKDQILASNKKNGTAGRLYFSNLYSVALYNSSVYDDNIQNIVDNKDSAAYFQYGPNMVIADHSNQGFNIIKNQKVGSKAYIKMQDANGKTVIKTYVLTEKINGNNTGPQLITADGRDVASVNTSLVMYTCNSINPKYITIVFWKEVV